MGADTVNSPERWRFWLDNGLSHVLGPLPWLAAANAEQTLASVPVASKRAIRFGQEGRAVLPAQPEKPQGMRKGLENDKCRDAGAWERPDVGPAAAQISTRGPQGAPQRPLPVDSWPEAWREAWGKTGFARPFLWTYAQLGEDLLGTPDPVRREVLRRLLACLNLGKVHNFWPFSESDGQGGLRLQARLFQDGVAHLAPRCIIFLGGDEFEGITPPGAPELFKVVSYFSSGVLCVRAPGIAELAANPALLENMAVLFQQKLSHLI